MPYEEACFNITDEFIEKNVIFDRETFERVVAENDGKVEANGGVNTVIFGKNENAVKVLGYLGISSITRIFYR